MIWIVAAWLFSRFAFFSLPLDLPACRALYFISTDIFIIAFFFNIAARLNAAEKGKKVIRGIVFAGAFFQIGMTVNDIMLFSGIGDVSKWYYFTILTMLTIIGYIYGAIPYKSKY